MTNAAAAPAQAAPRWVFHDHRTMAEVIELERLAALSRERALTRPLDIARLRHLRQRRQRIVLACGIIE